ncbi:Protein of uncharacterised function (DUF2744) [Mycobacteroides abscessus subsp. abscessus]|nr:Protein of uncharacterised function (DUF2744) [Mycobacteroides abscessus subsp. abscessus]SIK13609.1 Protein of uncharacterised function (DUF2744) [Mycobacteroides abscessus subsp. abscessus]SIN25711.1 Protein of uncharacterised function (DUF2744) [Mycobacteroides abscessus subsp. abscessus]SLI51219.1 Protein of uncharacterised function (DUF2744) [Mycobacteroides abscessus subsp. abscessus]
MPAMNPNFGMQNAKAADYEFTKGFPTRDNCDLENPREMFLWTLVALPGVVGAQLVMPISYNMAVSEHLYECGARPTAEPVKKWIAPKANGPHWMTSPGQWVPLDTPVEEQHPADVAIDKLSRLQQAELLERLLKKREQGEL